MPQQVAYEVRVVMVSGRIYHTQPLTTLAPDGVKVPDLFDSLVQHVVTDYAREKAAGSMWDIRAVRDRPGITLVHPDQVESAELIILSVGPANPVSADDIRDELDYDRRLAERFPDMDLPPTDVSMEGSGLQADQVPDGVSGVVLGPGSQPATDPQDQPVVDDSPDDSPEPAPVA